MTLSEPLALYPESCVAASPASPHVNVDVVGTVGVGSETGLAMMLIVVDAVVAVSPWDTPYY